MILAWLLGRLIEDQMQSATATTRLWAVLGMGVVLAGAEAKATRNQIDYWRDTETLYGRMISFAPHVANLYPTLGYALHDRGLPEEAIEAYRTAIRLNPEHRFVEHTHYLLGNILVEQGRPAEAVVHFQESIRRRPGFPDAYSNISVALAQLKEYEKAIQACRKALEIDNQHADALNNLGILLSDQNKDDEAIACFERVLQVQPRHDGAHNCLAIALARRGQMDEAVRHFRAALEIKPQNYDAHFNLGLTLGKLKDPDGANVQLV
jgi:tetratricopeptide (TPR) repeat protein